MTKINLLTKKESNDTPKGRNEFVVVITTIFFVVTVLLLTHLYDQTLKIRQTKIDIATTEENIKTLTSLGNKSNDLKIENRNLEQTIRTITDLENMGSAPLLIVDNLSNDIPKMAWINQFVSKGDNVNITAIVKDKKVATDFLKALRGSDYFDGARVQAVEEILINDLVVRKYKIRSKLNFLGKKQNEKKQTEK